METETKTYLILFLQGFIYCRHHDHFGWFFCRWKYLAATSAPDRRSPGLARTRARFCHESCTLLVYKTRSWASSAGVHGLLSRKGSRCAFQRPWTEERILRYIILGFMLGATRIKAKSWKREGGLRQALVHCENRLVNSACCMIDSQPYCLLCYYKMLEELTTLII